MMLFEDLEITRYHLKHPVKGETKTILLNPTQQKNSKYFKDNDTGIDYDVLTDEPLAEWLCLNFQNYGAKIEFITDKSQEGFQFVRGFGGIGGFLRYKVELDENYVENGEGGDDFDAETDFI